MNQILFNFKKNKKIFKSVFLISLLIFCFIFIITVIKLFTFFKYMHFSNVLSYNYNTYKVYSDRFSNKNISTTDNSYNDIKCRIDIPSLNISYPVFSNLSDENLKISPCIFFGELPPSFGNLCIAGHNYDNGKFFSLIYKLNKNDKIYIYDNLNREFCYSVFDNYEVKNNDLSPVYSFNNNSFELTLVTCNNFNNNRIIVKASLLNFKNKQNNSNK